MMGQVHCLWMTFIRFILYMRSAARSPCDGYSPGAPAVQRMKRQPRVAVTTTLTQLVTNPDRAKRQTISSGGVTAKYPLWRTALPGNMTPRATQEIAMVGATLSQKFRKPCIRTLTISSNQIGCVYWQALAVLFSSVQRPARRAGAPSHIS